MNNPEIWFPANKFTGKWLLVYAVLLLLISFVLPGLLAAMGYPPESERMIAIYSLIVAAFAIGGILVVFAAGLVHANRLAK